jgi:aspartyl-tRNA(Asn)/glutamyl-tRNA(Gln) amidotransferase subunit A
MNHSITTTTTIFEISEQLNAGKISPVELVEQCLQQIDDLNPKLNAFITVLHDQALAHARIAEHEIKNGKYRGPLHGVPVALKDFYDTAGIKTTAGSGNFADRVPMKDADCVTRLKNAGAIIIGKTNMHQLGMGTTGLDSYFGPVRNPINDSYIPGGSSSGSAVAVATDMCFASVDTDAIGSCRLPAACCGVTGFKGTYGLISTKGILEGEPPQDEMIVWFNHVGITARTIRDTAILLNTLVDRSRLKSDFAQALTQRAQLHVGIPENLYLEGELKTNFENTVKTIIAGGHIIAELPLPFGSPFAGIDYIKRDRENIAKTAFADIDIDVYVLPTLESRVPLVIDSSDPQSLSPMNTAFANYYGLPAATIPNGFDVNGMPTGFQIVGRPWDDVSVLQLALECERGGSNKMERESQGPSI